MKDRIAHVLKSHDVLEYANVQLKHTSNSDVYVNVKKIISAYPGVLTTVCDALWKEIDPRSTCIAVEGYGGLVLGGAIEARYNISLATVRPGGKDHGLHTLLPGYVPSNEDVVAVVDDVSTTGGSLQKILDILEPTNAEISGCHVVVKRGEITMPETIPFSYLCTLEDLLA